MNPSSLTATRTIGRMIAGILLIIGMTAGGCSEKGRIPSGILPREKMVDVLWDMIQADQYAALMRRDSTHADLKLERLRLYQQVFLLHKVSREQFQKSYAFYMAHPDLSQTLFDSLSSKGNRIREEAFSHPSFRPAAPIPAPKPSIPVLRPGPDTMRRALRHPSLTPLLHSPAGNPGKRPPAADSGAKRASP